MSDTYFSDTWFITVWLAGWLLGPYMHACTDHLCYMDGVRSTVLSIRTRTTPEGGGGIVEEGELQLRETNMQPWG